MFDIGGEILLGCLIIGIVARWLADRVITRRGGLGFVKNLIVGVIEAFVGVVIVVVVIQNF